MWTRIGLTLLLIVGGWTFYSPPAVHASCEVNTTPPTFANGAFIGADLCDANGAKYTTGSGGSAISTLGTATASAPTLVEGAEASFSFDLAGNARVTLGTLLSCEDQENNLCMTSGGKVRVTSLMTGVTTNTTSSAQILPVGTKTIFAEIVGTGTQSVTISIYGDKDTTLTNGRLLCTLTLSGTTTANEVCHITANYLYYAAKTESITGTGATVSVDGQY